MNRMEFGRVSNVDRVDFTLPPDPPATAEWLGRRRSMEAERADGTPRVLVGTSGWSDRKLVGKLYPRGTRSGDFLGHYARAFAANELNSTYYGFDAMRMAHWAATVPEGFLFCPKLPAAVSHEAELVGVEQEMEVFLEAASSLGKHLGRAWTILPPAFGPERFRVLEAFLDAYATRLPLAVELRHPRWFRETAAARDVFALLRERSVTPILTDVAGRRDVLHMQVCTDDTFVRFVGNGLHRSDFARLDAWGERLARWTASDDAPGGLGRVYFFLHQREEQQTLDLGRHLVPRWRELGLGVEGGEVPDRGGGEAAPEEGPRQGLLWG